MARGRRFIRRPGAALIAAAALAAAAVPAFAGTSVPALCAGLEPTIIGTDLGDTLTGTPGRDVISARGGDDEVSGLGAGDHICGGEGADRLTGGSGLDALVGGAGADLILGSRGTDAIRGGPGDDEAYGELGSDRLFGGAGQDFLEGGNGSDAIRGGSAADHLGGGRGNDSLDGGGAGDVVAGDLGDDHALGGAGSDEALGGLGIDVVNGGPGDRDYAEGGYGDDTVIGGSGSGDVGSYATAVAGPAGRGVFASLRRGIARGDGRDTLRRLENLEGSAFADVLVGDGGDNHLDGGPGEDRLRGLGGSDLEAGDGCLATGSFCRARKRAGVVALVDRSPAGGAGLVVLGGTHPDRVAVSYDPASGFLSVESNRPVGISRGCVRTDETLLRVACNAGGRTRHLLVDLGAGDDALAVRGALAGLDTLRFAGGPGDDEIAGGPGDELIEAGGGRDALHGGAGSDGVIGGIPGADRLRGGRGSDLLAAGGGCIGGMLRGGPGRDNASFAETPAHPGVLRASLAAGQALIKAVPGCRPVHLARSNEDLEGSFDWDVLIGDAGANNIYGQPGRDAFWGLGGRDVIDARDGTRDARIDCGAGLDIAFRDRHDPHPGHCGTE